jgi:sulfate/thiosulfate transport system substrate-binding protein
MLGKFRLRILRSFFALFFIGLGLSVAITACSPSGDSPSASPSSEGNSTAEAKPPVTLTLVSYAVTQAAYENIIPKFVEKWKSEQNQDVTFDQSYGGSGSQTRAVIDGLEADVVALALALDTQKIEKAGLIQSGWEDELPNGSIVHSSVAAFVTRDGNPKGVQTWEDLGKDGIQIVTANPKTSGGARWNFLGAWGAVTQTGGTEEQALDLVTKIYKNVPILAKDARESTDIFVKQGQGDVLINYENEAILAKQKGENVPYTVPTVNISIDNPITVVDANVDKHGTREVAEAFAQYVFTPEAQEEFAKVGFRPSDASVSEKYAAEFGKVDKLFTVKDLGGWDDIQTKFFEDGAVFDKIQSQLGKG